MLRLCLNTEIWLSEPSVIEYKRIKKKNRYFRPWDALLSAWDPFLVDGVEIFNKHLAVQWSPVGAMFLIRIIQKILNMNSNRLFTNLISCDHNFEYSTKTLLFLHVQWSLYISKYKKTSFNHLIQQTYVKMFRSFKKPWRKDSSQSKSSARRHYNCGQLNSMKQSVTDREGRILRAAGDRIMCFSLTKQSSITVNPQIELINLFNEKATCLSTSMNDRQKRISAHEIYTLHLCLFFRWQKRDLFLARRFYIVDQPAFYRSMRRLGKPN